MEDHRRPATRGARRPARLNLADHDSAAEGRLTLDEHNRLLDGTRARSVGLFGALSVAVGFLAGQVDRTHTPDVLIGCAIAACCLAVGFLAALNWPVTFLGNMHPGTLPNRAWSPLLSSRADAELAHLFGKAVHANLQMLRRLSLLFVAELVCGAASVALWAAACSGVDRARSA